MLIGYLWLTKANYSSIMHMTGCSSKIITAYMNFFCKLVISTLEDDEEIIGGPGIISVGKWQCHDSIMTNDIVIMSYDMSFYVIVIYKWQMITWYISF